MQRSIILTLLLCAAGFSLHGQRLKPNSISFSYLGEMITHPGFKIAANYSLKEWTKNTEGAESSVQKNILLSPSFGLFYHRRYQTGLLLIPEIQYARQKPNGSFRQFGIGLGYMKTLIPNTYQVKDNGSVEKVTAGHGYLATNYFICFGKDLQPKRGIPISYYVKPQWLLALPNFPTGTGYFMLEIGITKKLN